MLADDAQALLATLFVFDLIKARFRATTKPKHLMKRVYQAKLALLGRLSGASRFISSLIRGLSDLERPICVVLIADDVEMSVQLRWAAHIARLREMNLVFAQLLDAPQNRIANIALSADASPEEHPTTTALRRAILGYPDFVNDQDQRETTDPKAKIIDDIVGDNQTHSDTKNTQKAPGTTQVAAKIVYANTLSDTRKLLTHLVKAHDASLYTAIRSASSSEFTREYILERARFLAFLPCEVIVCQGFTEDTRFERIAVLERAGFNQRTALQWAVDLGREHDNITALRVNPDIGIDAQLAGERRLEKFVNKLSKPEGLAIDRQVIVDDSVQSGVQKFWTEGRHDLLVVPASTLKAGKEVGFRLGRNIPVAVTLSASPFASRTREIVQDTLRKTVPQIAREERVDLVERVQSNSEWNFDYVVLMLLSTGIAALGLMQNSAAVVIGAMLVAPLMTPILGLGLALVQGNLMLTRISVQALAGSVLVGLLAGVSFGLLNKDFSEPTREIFARTRPGVMDIAVAFLSGIAAAYAQSRPNLLAALPGVAIAAALVPPIVASGLLLSLWEIELAFGAFVLFVINMVAIILASMMALFAVGIRNAQQVYWPVRISGVLLATLVGLFVWGSTNSYQADITGEVPKGLKEIVTSTLGKDYELIDVAIAYDELGYQIYLDVTGTKPIPSDLANAVRLQVTALYGEASRVRLVARIRAENF